MVRHSAFVPRARGRCSGYRPTAAWREQQQRSSQPSEGADDPGAASGGGARSLAEETASKETDASDERLTEKYLIGFDFDCTLTIRHFYKVFAWGYVQGNSDAHPHFKAFEKWCVDRNIDPEMQGFERQDPMVDAVDDFCRQAGEVAFGELFREVFLGGKERIECVAAWLGKMQQSGAEFAIVTAGAAKAVLRGMTMVPEWLPFFPSDRIWDTSQGRHCYGSIAGNKALMLRDICPDASRILLVDDALTVDRPPAWVLTGAGVKGFELPYEGPGVNEDILNAIERVIFGVPAVPTAVPVVPTAAPVVSTAVPVVPTDVQVVPTAAEGVPTVVDI